MSKPVNTQAQKGMKVPAGLIIFILFIVAVLIYMFVFGASANFEGGDNSKHPVQDGIRSILGLIYKGGFIVPVLLACFLTAITFTIERFLTLAKASGTGKASDFVRKIQGLLNSDQVDLAIKECDRQKGSVANVVRSGLTKYREMQDEKSMGKDQKVQAIQQEFTETMALELPMLERNLPILSTIASVGTLIALLGTVIGMIKAFKALGTSGQPDTAALSTGISEALINTALGIGTSALAIVFYNMFTTRIDAMKFNIEEAGFSITQTFGKKDNN
jgi:biopolymer transport protein ExbB